MYNLSTNTPLGDFNYIESTGLSCVDWN